MLAMLMAVRPDDPACLPALRRTYRRLPDEVLPHEEAEEEQLRPALAGPSDGAGATAAASRAHLEIRRYTDRIGGHLARTVDGRPGPDQVPDLLASRYGLDALLRLHLPQEEENYLAPDPSGDR